MLFDVNDSRMIFYKELASKLLSMADSHSRIGSINGNPFNDGKQVGRWEGVKSVLQMLESERKKHENESKQEER
jgi:hypothetical protein